MQSYISTYFEHNIISYSHIKQKTKTIKKVKATTENKASRRGTSPKKKKKNLISEGTETRNSSFDPVILITEFHLGISFRDERGAPDGGFGGRDFNPSDKVSGVPCGGQSSCTSQNLVHWAPVNSTFRLFTVLLWL
mmetsp:Transcript_449/g.618  ORF Transcript_449/g.618 Transcript_449/m.618 type:complete len:136 (-) Transcript_449:2172-2579(-)